MAINVFVAGSKELKQKRDICRSVCSSLQNQWGTIYTKTFEDFPEVISNIGHQKEYNLYIDNKFVYFITDVIRGITMVVRPRRFNGVYVRFVNLLIIGLKLIGKLMGASLIYYGVLTFISIFVPSIDGSKWDIIDGLADLDRNMIARTLLSIFCLFFGRLLTKRQN